MERRNLGSEGLVVSALGLGCMGMSEFYGTGDEEESVATIRRLELTDEDLRRIEEAIPRGSAAGERYTEQQMRAVNR